MSEKLTTREILENLEEQTLCEFACLSKNSEGRQLEAPKDDLRTEFQRDRDKIIHSNSFRRLKQKTQVFLIPSGDHYRTRLTHTLEVSQIARTISKALFLNEDLTEAIALGHDLGHTPFGHAGERMLNELCPDGFKHYTQGLRVVDVIENEGKGLNLTYEVRDGILKHTNQIADTKEGYIVRLADVIAYINHDIDDSIRAGVIKESDLPAEITEILGHSKSERITTLVSSIISNGAENLKISDNIKEAHEKLHRFMFESVYTNSLCKSEEIKAQDMICKLYEHFCKNPDKMPVLYQKLSEEYGIERAVCDYVSGMTDSYAISVFSKLFIPVGWDNY
ncbi:MAG: deoxyguanosinetriphosphate triphosphohydrolase [Ruminococcus sp.]|nr:deoxyguanosinetriphosphate triphosphohydrolase [Ruminococcus sp.]